MQRTKSSIESAESEAQAEGEIISKKPIHTAPKRLLQEGRPAATASRALTKAEKNYAQIEKECLSIVFACEKFHYYIYGKSVKVESDHKPLEIISKKPIHTAPKRLQRMMREFCFDVNEEFEYDELCEVRRETAKDTHLQTVATLILKGWPQTMSKTPVDGLFFKGDRLVVPQNSRAFFIQKLHMSHQGIEATLRRAKKAYYWPRMNKIQEAINKCSICQTYQDAQQKEPLKPHPVPEGPWSKVGTDLMQLYGNNYLVTVCYYSGFFEVDRLQSTSSMAVIKKLSAHFARYGCPKTVMSDNGPQYASEKFKAFAKSYNFQHLTSSPHYPQSNEKVENCVKTVKMLMKKAYDSKQDVNLVFKAWRNTPNLEGTSTFVQQALTHASLDAAEAISSRSCAS